MERNGIKVYTVKELKEALEELVINGYGDRVVLHPDYDREFENDYRTIGSIDVEDMMGECVYLENLSDEDEIKFWEGVE